MIPWKPNLPRAVEIRARGGSETAGTTNSNPTQCKMGHTKGNGHVFSDWRLKPPMGKLNSSKRGKLPKSDFGLPGERKYPMPDKSHAANAKARATQQEKKGNLSESAKAKIDAKANKILKRGKK